MIVCGGGSVVDIWGKTRESEGVSCLNSWRRMLQAEWINGKCKSLGAGWFVPWISRWAGGQHGWGREHWGSVRRPRAFQAGHVKDFDFDFISIETEKNLEFWEVWSHSYFTKISWAVKWGIEPGGQGENRETRECLWALEHTHWCLVSGRWGWMLGLLVD